MVRFFYVAIGFLLAGLLVQYAPQPLRLSFIVHIALVLLAGVGVLVVPETSPRSGSIALQRLSVPVEVRGVFAIAAIAGFAELADVVTAGQALRDVDGIAALELIDARAASLTAGHVGVALAAQADDGVFETGVDVLNDLTNWLVDEALTQY